MIDRIQCSIRHKTLLLQWFLTINMSDSLQTIF